MERVKHLRYTRAGAVGDECGRCSRSWGDQQESEEEDRDEGSHHQEAEVDGQVQGRHRGVRMKVRIIKKPKADRTTKVAVVGNI